MALMNKEAIEKLIPHQGVMCFLEELIEYDENKIICKSINHSDPHHPLRIQDSLSSVVGVEYGAQAAALHSCLMHPNQIVKQGWLVQIKDAIFYEVDLSSGNGPLFVIAQRLFETEQGAFYQIQVGQESNKKIEARILVQFKEMLR